MNQAISAGHPLTAQAAKEILDTGGNAVDAGLAAYFMSFVAEPCMSSAGGGAFANIFFQKKSYLYDFFCQTPINKRPVNEVEFFPITVDFGDTTEVFHVGRGSQAVPGALAGAFELHKDFGTIPLKEIVTPAIEAAINGVKVVPFQYYDFELLVDIIKLTKVGREIFCDSNGNLKKVGKPTHFPEMAQFFEFIANNGVDEFYKGEIAAKIEVDHLLRGGYLKREDFENYRVIKTQPLSFWHKNYQVQTNPLPSTGGALMALILNHLEKNTNSDRSKPYIKNLFNSLKEVAQFGHMPDQLAIALKMNAALHTKKHGSTTHLNVVDKWGNALSLTTTNGEGSGYFIEGTQIQLNNMMGEAALVPHGFHNWVPNHRLSSMMAPTIVLDQHRKLEAVLGSGGAGRIPSMLAQVLHRILDYGLETEDAIMAPRIHFHDDVLNIELDGFDDIPTKEEIGFDIVPFKEKSLFMGGVHSIINKNGKFISVADQRREGVAQY